MRSSFIEKERTSSRIYSSTIVVSPDGAALARIRTGLATPATFAPTGPTAATRAKWEFESRRPFGGGGWESPLYAAAAGCR
jgi:hypothetical protein